MQKIKIGLRIQQRRKALGLTQEELAFKMGYKSKSTINKIEKGFNDVSQSNVVRFAEALQTTEAYLMGWIDNPDKKVVVTVPISQEAMENMLKAIPSSKSILLNSVDDEVSTPEVEKALELYRLYKSANPQIQNAVEVLLKPSQSDS